MKFEKEEWKDVVGYEGLYKVSNTGKLFNIKLNYIQKECKHCKGYLTVHLRKNKSGKSFLAHRIVAMAFIDNPNNLDQINHIDGVKTNNNINNLEWCTAYENQIHRVYVLKSNPSVKIQPVIQRRKNDFTVVNRFDSCKIASRETGISDTSICNNITGRSMSAGGYIWERE